MKYNISGTIRGYKRLSHLGANFILKTRILRDLCRNNNDVKIEYIRT